MYMIRCTHCDYLGPADQVKRHFDGRLVLRCPRCCGVGSRIKILAISATGGQTFGKVSVQAGGKMSLFKRGAAREQE